MTDELIDNTKQNRFEYHIENTVVFANYRRQGQKISIDYVEAPLQLRGSGAAGKLMHYIMERARQENLSVTPICGYAVSWLQRHSEYKDLLA